MDELQKILAELSLKETELYQILDVRNEVFLSYFFDVSQIQDSFRFRARHYAFRLASYLIDEEGKLQENRLTAIILLLQKNPYLLSPGRENDAILFAHYRRVLKTLLQSSYVSELEKFRLPLCHKKAEEFIRDTVQKKLITNADLRIAVLSAWLTPLRQNVGSCFATAPAILIQDEMPERFLKDMMDLLHTGRISRVIEGKEYIVPLNQSWGMGDLLKPFSLLDVVRLSYSPGIILALVQIGVLVEGDSWEQKERKCYQLFESFQPEKPQNIKEFFRLVLLSKIEISEEDIAFEKGRSKMMVLSDSVHPFAYQVASLSAKEKKVQEFDELWDKALSQFRTLTDHPLLKAWEFSLASLSDVKLDFTRWNLYVSLGLDPKEPGGMGAFLYELIEKKLNSANEEASEYQFQYERAANFVNTTENLILRGGRDASSLQSDRQTGLQEMQYALTMRDLAHKRASLYAELFASLLNNYYELFQEYFQELYDPEIQEVKIQSYNDSPAGFRLVYKHGRRDPSAWTSVSNAEEYISSLRDFFHQTENRIQSFLPAELQREVSDLITEITLFIQSAPFLEGAIQRMQSSHQEKESRRPWSYPSGGTMENLLRVYFKQTQPLHLFLEKIENEVELFLFYLAAAKICDQNSPESKYFLSLSPTHAFLFIPSLMEACLRRKTPSDAEILGKKFFGELVLDDSAQRLLLDEITLLLPSQEGAFKAIFPRHFQELRVPDFRMELVQAIKNTYKNTYPPGRFDCEKLVDSFLYSALPLQKGETALENACRIFEQLNLSSPLLRRAREKMRGLLTESLVSAKKFRQKALASLMYATENLFSEQHLSLLFLQMSREMHLCYPLPILFADTNWPGSFFGWVISPYTLSWELWALDRVGSQGFPMTDWKNWFDNSRLSEWGVYYKAVEYS